MYALERTFRPHFGGVADTNLPKICRGHEDLDPQRVASATEANISRLTTRTLTTFKSEPGSAASEIVGDLATDTGRPSDNNKVWDFKLKDDLRWEDGSPITCADIKYGTERSFSTLFNVSQVYAKTYLANTDGYAGPFVGGNNNGSNHQNNY